MNARAVHGGSHRFIPSAEGLVDLFRRYEEERSLGGMDSALQRVSPGQRIDTIVTILGLNAAGGWRRAEGESAEQLWLRYLTPVLAETRESGAALAFALDRRRGQKRRRSRNGGCGLPKGWSGCVLRLPAGAPRRWRWRRCC
jgi:hypothetical protein